ncbi:unnamed protein product, partial [Brachionus calyciflorus]
MAYIKVFYCILIVSVIGISALPKTKHLREKLKSQKYSKKEYESAVMDLINRIVGKHHNVNDFIVVIDENLSADNMDTFELEMVNNNKKLQIKATNAVTAAWGFNHYLKYYTNSSVFWSGKNINLDDPKLPVLPQKVRITSKDYVRFYQNVCTYSYSYVWWDWERWEYEIDWMALNGINMVYAQTAAEYPWIKVLEDLGFTREEIDSFFAGPAYLAWFRMGNLKKFGGPLPQSWHLDQLDLQLKIIARYDELGIKYVLPAFAGFVPDQITRLYPNNNFTKASDWIGFNCNFSCLTMVDPLDPLFTKIGSAYNNEVIKLFGSSGFYSADVFNEMLPKSADLDYLAVVNQAVFNSLTKVDSEAIWVMQGWVFNQPFWDMPRVEAFLSRIPLGRLLILDLYAETLPHFNEFSSYFGHNFVWNMLHNFGGANGIFGDIQKINTLPDQARVFPNSSMVGVGLTMEGINQNEIMYDFMIDKTFRATLNESEFNDWVLKYAARRYSNSKTAQVDNEIQSILSRIIGVIYRTYDYQHKQLFTKRPSFDLKPENFPNMDIFYKAWSDLVKRSSDFQSSNLFKYDLIDFTKEALRYIFDNKYTELKGAWFDNDLYKFSQISSEMTSILDDMEELLASDEHYLLAKWLNEAKSKGLNSDERNLYEFNARSQLTLWGLNSTNEVFDYACKAWSGLVADYYIPRWNIFFTEAKKSLLRGIPIDLDVVIENLLVNAELPFIFSKKEYPSQAKGDTFSI